MVQSITDDWQELSHIWISNGEVDCQGRVELRVRLESPVGVPALAGNHGQRPLP